mmetsp:Transcript_45889/g.110501  ORF Transcript_45889/g.110501 Transcript_45889/m.110501 type:complete len:209 (-) Transcript_45889:61-687(-)
MEVAIALSLLLAESADKNDPLRGKFCTFHEYPEIVTVKNIPDHAAGIIPELGALKARQEQLRSAAWGGSTNFVATFHLLLQIAQQTGMSEEDLAAKTVTVFSDMQFGAASTGNVPWQTTHEQIQQMYNDAGYSKLPHILYWNLRANTNAPTGAMCTNETMLSGFSSALLETFLKGELDQFTPKAQLAKLLAKPPCAMMAMLATQRTRL